MRQTAITAQPQVNARPPIPVAKTPPTPGGLMALADSATQDILAVTYWFNPAPQPRPYAVTIKFTGHRRGVQGPPQPGDRFTHYEMIDAVVSGSGPVSITARIGDIHPGEWAVTAHVLAPVHAARRVSRPQVPEVAAPVPAPRNPVARFWRWWAPATGSVEEAFPPVKTCSAIFARTPGIFPGAWIAFVLVGLALALVIQSLVIGRDRLAIGPVVWVDVVAIMVGFIGAKVWYIVKHRRERGWVGWCIQGFTTGATLAAVIMLVALHVSVGLFLDIIAPGMFVGMAVGRIGCFFAGCCGGPPTASRWGVWSSDQRVGARRVPTQLLESAFTLSLGLGALAGILGRGPAGGAFFIAGLAAYILGRQGILRLRTEPHRAGRNESITTALAALVLAATIIAIVLHAR